MTKTKLAVVGMMERDEDREIVFDTKDLLRSLDTVDIKSIRKDVSEQLALHMQGGGEAGDVLDLLFEKGIDLIDSSDAVLVIAPIIDPTRPDSHRFQSMGFVEMSGFMMGYAWSQGKPCIYYTCEENKVISYFTPIMGRVIHASLTSPKELLAYDWIDLPTNSKRRGSEVLVELKKRCESKEGCK